MNTPSWDAAVEQLGAVKDEVNSAIDNFRGIVRKANFTERLTTDYGDELLRRALVELGHHVCIREEIGECAECALIFEIAAYLDHKPVGVDAHE